jgi:hypothetical protein
VAACGLVSDGWLSTRLLDLRAFLPFAHRQHADVHRVRVRARLRRMADIWYAPRHGLPFVRHAPKHVEVANRGFTGAEYIATNFIASVSYDCKVRTARAAEGHAQPTYMSPKP